MSKHLVLAGGGHAHLTTLARIGEFVGHGFRVSVIGPSDHHYYSGMGPGMLGGFYRPEEIRFATRSLTEKLGGTFVPGAVAGIDPVRRQVRLESGKQIAYDVLSCNLGSHVPKQAIAGPLDDIFPVKPIERLDAARRRIIELGATRPLHIGVIGGGPSAVEIAGNLWRLGRQPGMQSLSITVFPGRGLLPRHPEKVRRRVLYSLRTRGIEIASGRRIGSIRAGQVEDLSGTVHQCDVIFVAVGVRPSPLFAESGLPVGPDGGMLVNEYLQSTEYDTIFGGGDCISLSGQSLDKVGVYAVRQNPVLYHNLMARLRDEPLRPFQPGGRYLLIFNLGDGTGIFYKWPILFGGRPAFLIKDWIDRRFMREFQRFE